ncbi:MAG: hypothetical protein JJE49_09820 [Peptostreptococcaceae bacterium]|nr:hypothetical protein [Peptostreptococcaceae bacterium]
MKKFEIIKALSESFGDVVAHPAVGKEICDLVLGTGSEKEFFRLFKKQLNFINELGNKVTELEQFEKITSAPGLYSMHLESKNFNIRVLYSFDNNMEILLHCFYERQGKSVTSYLKHIPIALKRKKEMEKR